MEYVEILRARRVLTWYCAVLLAALAITAVSMVSGHAHVGGGHPSIALSAILSGCAFGAMIVATCVAPGLNAESNTLAIAWTRPVPRPSIVLRYIAVDVAAIIVAYAYTFAIVLAFCALLGFFGHIFADADIPLALLNGLGCALMWYGLIMVVAAPLNGRGNLVAGLSWGVFVVGGALWAAPFPAAIHTILTFVNYFNPMTYFAGGSTDDNHSHHVLMLNTEILTLIAWVFVAVTLVAAVRLWSTREV
ncbi:MAG TPA: hypothetical protein VFE70_02015 [Candidatus Elarobacter sp.]|nr:hypothetical protein [Candidatus Elarobacter sp.]